MPWLLALAVAAAGAAFLLWRSRSRPAYASGPQTDYFAAPEPEPAAAPAPRPAPAPQPRWLEPERPAAPRGIVSSGLRPWIDVGVQPARCVVTDESVTVDFEIELFNSGSAPARDIFVEAVMINAGATQDQDLVAFFTRPPGTGDRIDVIPPLGRTSFNTQVVTPRTHVQAFAAGDREVFVPLLAFNAFYRRGSDDGQTSTAYLLGREGKTEKLAPFRLDLGPRIFRGLGARPLPSGVRR
jgi:hypothetical protein